MKIFLAADHKGVELAKKIFDYLKDTHEVEYTKLPTSSDDDYPDFAFDVCANVVNNKNSLGILLCGNGIGISIAANKVKGIRCARVTTVEDAHHAKNHNGANVIAFGGIPFDLAKDIVNTFIETESPLEERHLRRINKIIKYEE